ncbi:hypothetical protein PRNP1_009335 [Phytophthora ramorum]
MLQFKMLDHFATKNKTHLGRQCRCDWMRRLDGLAHEDECSTIWDMPILENLSGVRVLADALILTKKVLLPYCTHDGHGEDLSAPVMCLLTEGEEGIFTKEAAVKAMNRIGKRAGKKISNNFTAQRGYTRAGFVDEHWSDIEGSMCQHCINLPTSQVGTCGRTAYSLKWKAKAIERARANCKNVYRPLKVAMTTELQFVRFIPTPHKYVPRPFKTNSFQVCSNEETELRSVATNQA